LPLDKIVEEILRSLIVGRIEAACVKYMLYISCATTSD